MRDKDQFEFRCSSDYPSFFKKKNTGRAREMGRWARAVLEPFEAACSTIIDGPQAMRASRGAGKMVASAMREAARDSAQREAERDPAPNPFRELEGISKEEIDAYTLYRENEDAIRKLSRFNTEEIVAYLSHIGFANAPLGAGNEHNSGTSNNSTPQGSVQNATPATQSESDPQTPPRLRMISRLR